MLINVGDDWKTVASGYINVGDTWVLFYPPSGVETVYEIKTENPGFDYTPHRIITEVEYTVTVDNVDAGFTKTPNSLLIDSSTATSGPFAKSGTATYSSRTGSSEAWGGSYYTFAGSTSATRTYSAIWTPTVMSGTYDIYVKSPSDSDSLTRLNPATYNITHNGGNNNYTLDQDANSSTWNLLATLNLSPGNGVVTMAGTFAAHTPAWSLSVDAVRWINTTSSGYWAPVSTGWYSVVPEVTYTATWTPVLTLSGLHTVQVYYSANATRTTTAQYVITTSTGVAYPAVVNQEGTGSTWVSLGVYTLDPATANVSITHTPVDVNDTISVDGARFLFEEGWGYHDAIGRKSAHTYIPHIDAIPNDPNIPWSASYSFLPTVSGNYDVSVFLGGSTLSANALQYVITTATGVVYLPTIDQDVFGLFWTSIGTYPFTPEASGVVAFTYYPVDDNDRPECDAMRFRLV